MTKYFWARDFNKSTNGVMPKGRIKSTDTGNKHRSLSQEILLMMPSRVQKGLRQPFLESSVLNQLLPNWITCSSGSGQAKVISDGLKVLAYSKRILMLIRKSVHFLFVIHKYWCSRFYRVTICNFLFLKPFLKHIT